MLLKWLNRVLFIIALLAVSFVNAQNSKVRVAQISLKPHYNKLEEAKKAIDIAAKNEKTINKPKTWMVRGDVYQALSITDNEKFKALSENPLTIAFDSYKNALLLDKKAKYKTRVHEQLKPLSILLINKAISEFDNTNYEKALVTFEGALEIDIIINANHIDTIVIYNAGLTAEKALFYDKAIYYYHIIADLGYQGSNIYGYMANIESNRGDTAAYLGYLKKGMDVYPDDSKDLIVTLIRHYLLNNESTLALEYLTKAIEIDSTNSILYFSKGALYDKLGNYSEAKLLYKKAIDLNDNYFDANFNLGSLYFNLGVTMLLEANDIPSNKKEIYTATVTNSFVELEKAIPFLEKAHSINSTDRQTIIILRDLYFKLRNGNVEYMKRYVEMNRAIKTSS